ncbi:MAG: phage holin family protein [Candidatus Binatia bacterium]|nr:phage holin family protein [Candidatus Binatia bacterium]
MPGFLLRTLINAVGLWIASALIPGLSFTGSGTLLLAAFLLGIVNAVVRPLVIFLTLPITVLTLGVFLFVINALMLMLVAALLDGFLLSGFWAALFGSFIVSLTSWFASWYIGPRGKFEILVVRRDVYR